MPAVSTFIAVGTLAAGAAAANSQAQAGKAAGKAGVEAGRAAALNAGVEAGTARFQGEEKMRVARTDAENVLDQGRVFRSSQRAVAAASGFLVDSGTMQTLMEETDKLAQTDALAMLESAAQEEAMMNVSADNLITTGTSQAAALRQQGMNSAAALRGQAVGTLGSAFAGFAPTGQKMYDKYAAPKK